MSPTSCQPFVKCGANVLSLRSFRSFPAIGRPSLRDIVSSTLEIAQRGRVECCWAGPAAKKEILRASRVPLAAEKVGGFESGGFHCFPGEEAPADGSELEERMEPRASADDKVGRRLAMATAGAALWSSVSCKCCCETASAAEQWDYGNPEGPGRWQGLCASGPNQSPIDIPMSRAQGGEALGELVFSYGSSSPSILNPGHGTMQVSFPKGKNFLVVGGRVLQLLQFHFHAPSEHAFDGERHAMEAHLVHRDVEGKGLAVVGIMLDARKSAVPNKCLATSLAYAPLEHGRSVNVEDVKISPKLLLPPPSNKGQKSSIGYVHYIGSLSTPPCSEGVDWFVLDTPVEISSAQVLDFMRFAGDGHGFSFNSRPLQPLGPRAIFKGP